MKVALLSLYKEYLKKESIYLEKEKLNLDTEREKASLQLENVKQNIAIVSEDVSTKSETQKELIVLEKNIKEIQTLKNEIERKLGRIEGMIEMQIQEKAKEKIRKEIREERRIKERSKEVSASMSQGEIKKIIDRIHNSIDEAIGKENLSDIHSILFRIKDILGEFIFEGKKMEGSGENDSTESIDAEDNELELLRENQQEILIEIENIGNEENKIIEKTENLKRQIVKENEILHQREKEKFNFRVKYQELSSNLELISVKEKNLLKETEAFENEIKEGSVLVGGEILSFKNFAIESAMPAKWGGQGLTSLGEAIIDREAQAKLRRKLERLKIKLEDIGLGTGFELIKEFGEISRRDDFLAKEMTDLDKSIDMLENVISGLKDKIDVEFKAGILKINIEFTKFFSLMFDGGGAHLSIVIESKHRKDEEEENIVFEKGIEINVSLPHKKVKKLNALSGGERSLTSIALLFAMSQVNPPPFLVLDETDAALDEANSRKYGDMLEKLSLHSQLIVVTHNRETMSRAGVLYGITVGKGGASRLLSVKLDEATQIAK